MKDIACQLYLISPLDVGGDFPAKLEAALSGNPVHESRALITLWARRQLHRNLIVDGRYELLQQRHTLCTERFSSCGRLKEKVVGDSSQAVDRVHGRVRKTEAATERSE